MALDFSFSDISKFFSDTKEDANNFFEGTTKKITNSFEERKNEFVDFTKELKSNAKELIDTTADKVDKKFDSLSETAAQKAKEVSTLVEKFIDEIPEKTSAAISKAETKINEFKIDAKEWIEENVTWENTKAVIVTVPASVLEEFIGVGEGVFDSLIYAAGGIGELFGKDNKWAEKAIAYDVSKKMYDAIIDVTGVNKDIAYGKLRDVGNFAGGLLGYYALSCVPYAGPVLSVLGGVGKGAEESINDQMEQTGTVNEGKVFISSLLGGLEGFGYGKMMKGATQAISAIKQLGKEGIKTLGKETVKKFFTENFGKILKQTAISTATDKDTYLDTLSVIANNIYSYIDTGEMDWGKLLKETGAALAFSFIANIGGSYIGDAMQDMFKKSDLDDYLVPTNQIDDIIEKEGISEVDNFVNQTLESANYTNSMLDVDSTDQLFDIDTTEPMIDSNQIDQMIGVDESIRQTNSKMFDTYDEFKAANAQVRTEWEAGLSDSEIKLIKNYIGESEVSSYVTMNGVARGTCINPEAGTVTFYHAFGSPKTYTFEDYFDRYGESVSDFYDRTLKESAELDAAIRRCKLPQDTIVARGMDANALNRFGIDVNLDSAETIMAKLGGTYSDAGFMSSTPVAGGGFTHKPVNLIMDCPAGSACADFATFNPNEQEVLFPMGQQFNVDDVVKKDGKLYIYMTLKGE